MEAFTPAKPFAMNQREAITAACRLPEPQAVTALVEAARLPATLCTISRRAAALVIKRESPHRTE